MPLSIIFLGDADTGKTNLITRFVGNVFSSEYPPTIEEVYSKRLGSITLTITDLGGNEDYDRLRALYSERHADFFVITYAVDNKSSWENLEAKWIPLARHWKGDVPVVVVGCKADLGQPGSADPNILCSALHGWGCKEVFETIVGMAGFTNRIRRD